MFDRDSLEKKLAKAKIFFKKTETENQSESPSEISKKTNFLSFNFPIRKIIIWFLVAVLVAAIIFSVSFILTKYRYFFFPSIEVSTQAPPPKLLFLGIDGADPDTIEKLVAAGRMPNIKFLIENGVYARPIPPSPVISSALWNTVATGTTPAKHGIDNFFTRTENANEYNFVQSSDRKVKAIWNIFTEKGYKVGMFDWEASFPLEKTLGYTIADTAMLDLHKSITPADLVTDLQAYLTRTIGLSKIKDENGLKLNFPIPKDENDHEFFRVAHEKIELYNDFVIKASQFAFHTRRPEVLFQLDNVLDAAQHLFLKFQRPEDYKGNIDPVLLELYGDFIDELYVQRDNYIGEFLKTIDEKTHVIVMSDSGFFVDSAQGFRPDKLDIILEILGFLKKNPDNSINFSETKAFECFSNSFDWQRNICINLEGKYEQGIVDVADFESVKSQLLNQLQAIKTESGESIYHSVSSSNSVDFDISYDLRRDIVKETVKISGKEFQMRDFMSLSVESGSHYANPLGPPAFFVWMGPSIRKGAKLDQIEFTDFAVNILHAFDLPIGRDMDGVYIADIFEKPKAPKYIESYEENPGRIFSGIHESLDESDRIFTENNRFSFYSSNKNPDSHKKVCFQIPENIQDYKLQIESAKSGPETDLEFVPEGNPKLLNSISLPKETFLNALPRRTNIRFLPKDFTFQSRSEELYSILAPLDSTKNQTLGIWTDMFFTVQAPSAGIMKIIASGTKADEQYPIIEVAIDNEVVQQIQIDASYMKSYEIEIPRRSRVRFAYINDLKTPEDRNLFIEQIKFSRSQIPQNDDELEVYLENEQLCFENKILGSVQVIGRINQISTTPKENLGQDEVLKVWDDIGVIDQ
jgi:predicted AlkP superfamily phosphohydrolase/phosphomutase